MCQGYVFLLIGSSPLRYSNEIDRTNVAEAELAKAKAKFGKKLWQIEEERAAGAQVCLGIGWQVVYVLKEGSSVVAWYGSRGFSCLYQGKTLPLSARKSSLSTLSLLSSPLPLPQAAAARASQLEQGVVAAQAEAQVKVAKAHGQAEIEVGQRVIEVLV